MHIAGPVKRRAHPGASWRQREERKQFFFEKKNQKTFVPLDAL
jgi:hypothetical protein